MRRDIFDSILLRLNDMKGPIKKPKIGSVQLADIGMTVGLIFCLQRHATAINWIKCAALSTVVIIGYQ